MGLHISSSDDDALAMLTIIDPAHDQLDSISDAGSAWDSFSQSGVAVMDSIVRDEDEEEEPDEDDDSFTDDVDDEDFDDEDFDDEDFDDDEDDDDDDLDEDFLDDDDDF